MTVLFPDLIVYRSEHFIVAQDWEVPIPAFFVIATVRKTRSIMDFSDAEIGEFGEITRKVRKAMKEVLDIEDVYFFQNEDTEHGFHLWVFPRYAWMNVFGTKVESIRPVMNYAKEQMISEEHLDNVKIVAERMRRHLMLE